MCPDLYCHLILQLFYFSSKGYGELLFFFSGRVLQRGSSVKKTPLLTNIFWVSNKDVTRFWGKHSLVAQKADIISCQVEISKLILLKH